MEWHQVNEQLYRTPDGKFAVERGPVRKVAIATEELFASEALAKHYRLGAKDSLGKIITLGKEFAYVDWRSPKDSWPWKAYRDTPYQSERAGPDGTTVLVDVPYMEQIGEFPTLAEAQAACTE